MQVLVTVPSGEVPGEWAIVELQGDLESREHSALSGKFIGDLHYNNQGTPILIIGHHILHGKLVKLDKPLAVMEKTHENELQKNKTLYAVKAMVSKKLLFKTRPKPIVANVS